MSKTESVPWRAEVLAALHRNRSKSESRYLQLATVDENHLPRVRTLVYRGFIDTSATLVMHTDIRSEKVGQLKQHNQAQIAWYFTKSREQFRLSGEIRIIEANGHDASADALRKQHWQKLSEAARSAYFWPEPGTVLGLNESHQQKVPNAFEADKDSSISDHFALLLMSVTGVDHLQLKPSPHKRSKYVLVDNQWQEVAIHP